jgi:ribosomal-protein-alanine N-acetyltransferase
LEGIIIREMQHSDLPQVCVIEKGSHTVPWSNKSFEYEIENKDAFLRVAVLDEKVAGYICIRMVPDLINLLNLTVSSEFRRMGIASMLLNDAPPGLRHLKPDTEITLEVRESNTTAIRLYEKYGFSIKCKRQDYYKTPDEDAIIMNLVLRDYQNRV